MSWTLLCLSAVLFSVNGLVACAPASAPAPADHTVQGAPPPAPAMRPLATVRDVMDGIIDPSADFIWESVQVEATTAGTTRKAPTTDDDWAAVRRHAYAVAEAGNLLMLPDRQVAPPDAAKPVEGSMDLPPAAITALIAKDPGGWIAKAHGLQEAALVVVKAADAKDVAALFAAGETLDTACESCHATYWYPTPK